MQGLAHREASDCKNSTNKKQERSWDKKRESGESANKTKRDIKRLR